MTNEQIIAFSKHLVKVCGKKRRAVRIPALTGQQLGSLLQALEKAHGYSL